MIKETKKYIPCVSSHGNNLCIEVGYDLGGINWFNGTSERRGYYLYCTPCSVTPREDGQGREYNTITSTLGVGLKFLLKEVTRRSKKAEQEAIALAKEKETELVNCVCRRYGIVLKEKMEESE